MKYHAEYTDTSGGEANYCWLKTAKIEAETDLQAVRRAKAALGLAGVRCRRETLGETIKLIPLNSCTVIFITPLY